MLLFLLVWPNIRIPSDVIILAIAWHWLCFPPPLALIHRLQINDGPRETIKIFLDDVAILIGIDVVVKLDILANETVFASIRQLPQVSVVKKFVCSSFPFDITNSLQVDREGGVEAATVIGRMSLQIKEFIKILSFHIE